MRVSCHPLWWRLVSHSCGPLLVLSPYAADLQIQPGPASADPHTLELGVEGHLVGVFRLRIRSPTLVLWKVDVLRWGQMRLSPVLRVLRHPAFTPLLPYASLNKGGSYLLATLQYISPDALRFIIGAPVAH